MNDPRQDHSTAPASPLAVQSDAAKTVPIRDKLIWSWDDVAALTGLSGLMEREVCAGRMPPPDVRIGRRACFRPATITNWLDSRKGGR